MAAKGFDFLIPEDCKTGTPLDDYMMLMKAIMFHGQSIIKFTKEGKELLKASGEFEKRFKPGTDTGVFDSLYMGWQYLECRFGKSGLTIGERFMKEDFFSKLHEQGQKYVKDIADSYCTFYEVSKILDYWIYFKELGTGRRCKVHKIDEDFENNSREGFIWYVRFVGIPEEGYPMGTPYVLTVRETEKFETAVKQYKTKIGMKHKHAVTEQEIFREYCREYTPYWADYIVRMNEISIN